MGKKRGNGEGEIERLPSGKFRARKSKMIGTELVRESKTFTLRGKAVEWLRDHRAPAKSGTLSEWVDTWLEVVKSERTLATYEFHRGRAAKWIKPKLGTRKLRDLDSLSCVRFLAQVAEECSSSERAKAGIVLKTCLNAAVTHGQIPASPMDDVRIPPVEPADKRAMLPEQLQAILKAAAELGVESLCRLWADAGLRPGEVFGLEWDDFDFDAGTVRVRRAVEKVSNTAKSTKTKAGRRTIKLAPSTVAALRSHRVIGQTLVLPANRGGYMRQASFHRDFWIPLRAAAGAGLEWITPYTFRHTMATLLLRSGVPLKVVSERLGHANPVITLKHYAHVLEGDQDRAAGVMEGYLNPVPHALPTAGDKRKK